MQKIVRLPKSKIRLSDDDLVSALEHLKLAGALESYKLREGEVSIVVDSVRAEMLLEQLEGIEPHNPENVPVGHRYEKK